MSYPHKIQNLMQQLIIVVFLILLSCEKHEDNIVIDKDFSLNYLTLGISFPPVSDEAQRNFTKPLLDELKVKHIRFSEEWMFREPTEGNFNWETLDARINWAFNNDYRILLTIQSNGPMWACNSFQNDNSCVYSNPAQFKNYIEQLLQRYTGKISKIQFGNEWQSEFWYIGSAQEFTEANNIVFNAVQAYSPNTKVVLGGFTAISLRFLAGCNSKIYSFYDDEGIFYDTSFFSDNCTSQEFQTTFDKIVYILDNAQHDELDIHLYDDVEKWDEYYTNFRSMTQKPIIVSEFGGPNMNYETYSDAYQSDRLYEYIKKLDSLEITEAYYFKLVEGTDNPAHDKSGLIRKSDLRKKESFEVFTKFTN